MATTLPSGRAADAPPSGQGSIQFIGTATTLIQACGFTVLTDPNFLHRGEHARLGYGLRSTRLTDPALEIDDLPNVDLVVLSHYHEDHFDRVAEAKLPKRLPIVTTPPAAKALGRKGFSETRPLRRWETQTFRKGEARIRITALPARHGPPLVSKALPATMGSLVAIEPRPGARPLRLYVSGDTLVHDDLREIPRRYPDIDLGLLHLGGTRVLGLLVTMDGHQGVELLKMVQPRTAVPIHYDDYTVFKSPLEDFHRAAAEAGLTHRVREIRRGETFAFPLPT